MNHEDVRLVKEEKVKPAGKKKSGVSDNRPRTESRESRMTLHALGSIPSPSRTVQHGEPLARSAVSQTTLQSVAENQIKRCYLWILNPMMTNV